MSSLASRLPELPAATSSPRWSLAGASAADASGDARWATLLRRAQLTARLRPDASDAPPAVATSAIGPLRIARVRSGPLSVHRTRAAERDRNHGYYLITKVDCDWSLEQGRRQLEVRAGDLAMLSARDPFSAHFAGTANLDVLLLPTPWTASWVDQPERLLLKAINGQNGWGRLLRYFISELDPTNLASLPLPAAVIAHQIGAMLALVAGRGEPESGRAPGTPAAQIAAAIQARFNEVGLTAGAVARELGISERTLHRVLQRANTTFSTELSAIRMANAKRMLDMPVFDRVLTGEIGRRVGIADPSHFVRLFKQHHGAAPAAYRRSRRGA